MAEGEPTVTYTVKEMLARVEGKVDLLVRELPGKANVSDVVELRAEVNLLKDEIAIERAVARSIRRLVVFGVPGFVSFVGGVTAIVFRFVN